MNQAAALSYTLNREGAIKASGQARIVSKGAYTGVLTRAEFTQSTKGTLGIDITFKSDDGATADYLTIWTQNKDGEELSGRALVDALMTCMRVKKLEARRAKIEKYNPTSGQREQMPADIYPDLMNKPIGLLLVCEEYLSTRNERKTKMVIAGCFEAATDKTAREILENLPATALPAIVASLRDKPLSTAAAARTGGVPTHAAPPSHFDEDLDIPF